MVSHVYSQFCLAFLSSQSFLVRELWQFPFPGVVCFSNMRLESIQNNDDDVNWDDDGDDDEDCVDDDDDDESQNNHQCHSPNSMLLFATTSIAQTRVPDKRRNIVHCFSEI